MEDGWYQLAEAYKSNGIVLVLGAGASYDSNIPSWNDLMKKLTETTDGLDGAIFEQMRKSGLSLQVIASLLEEKCGKRADFVERVRAALYADFPFHKRVDKHNRWEFVQFIRKGRVKNDKGKYEELHKPNSTLRSIGALCVVRRKEKARKRNVANPKIRAIVTLNMDALLETYVYAFSTRHLIRTVERSSAEPKPGCINLYHMHGYLHFDQNWQMENGEADGAATPVEKKYERDAMEQVVLTEQDYFDFFNAPNSMFNYTFLYLLREYTCLFIGLSMDDENIRRLLHYSKLERLNALANKSNLSLEELMQKNENIREQVTRHFAILPSGDSTSGDPQMVKIVDNAREETLSPLGVRVLWIKKFTEIRDRLQMLYQSVPEDKKNWPDVYDRTY